MREHLCDNRQRGDIFSVRSFWDALFIYGGIIMGIKIPKKVIDVTGIELTPGEPDVCLGNGEQGFECCCDECDYFLLCCPEYEIKINEDEPSILTKYNIERPKKKLFGRKRKRN